MRLHILHDRAGRILAASSAQAEEDGLVVPRPVPISPGQTAVELEVPGEYRDSDLQEICRELRVGAEKQLVSRKASE
ncbi:hypothetical protein BGK72_38235 [Streptomyces agglomeratus]|nr:hypothetical protein BGK72_38235 [Streptomyces agglomeratus]